jgi:hypothetical protein
MVPENSATNSKRIGTRITRAEKTICLEGVILAEAAGAGSDSLRVCISRLFISAFINFESFES